MSDARERYRKSKAIGFDEWHDGEGYDLQAFAAMTLEERDTEAAAVREIANPDWRDLEVLRAHGGRDSIARLRDHLLHPSINLRAHALRELIVGGHTPGSVADVQLAHVLNALVDEEDGLTAALLLAQEHAGPMSKLALLRGVQSRPAVALHFAAALLDLAGASNDMAAFDPKFRPVLLRLLPTNALEVRSKAFEEVCRAIDIEPGAIPAQGSGEERKWAERMWGSAQ